jgi:hypothetical protein
MPLPSRAKNGRMWSERLKVPAGYRNGRKAAVPDQRLPGSPASPHAGAGRTERAIFAASGTRRTANKAGKAAYGCTDALAQMRNPAQRRRSRRTQLPGGTLGRESLRCRAEPGRLRHAGGALTTGAWHRKDRFRCRLLMAARRPDECRDVRQRQLPRRLARRGRHEAVRLGSQRA